MADVRLCECGCGTPCAKRYVRGHNRRGKTKNPQKEMDLQSLVLACWAQRLNIRETADALDVSERVVGQRRVVLGLRQKPCGMCGGLTNDPDNLCYRCLHWKMGRERRATDPRENYIPTGALRDVLEILSATPDGRASTWYIERLHCSSTGTKQLPVLQRKGLVERVARGEWRITEDGRHVLGFVRAKDHETEAEVVVTA